MGARDEIISEVAVAFDEIRGAFGDDAQLEFLKINDSFNDFDTVSEVDSGWFIEYAAYRNQFKLQVATLDDDFRNTANQSSNVRIGDEVYWIEKGDTLPPGAASVFWTFFCGRGFSKANFNRF